MAVQGALGEEWDSEEVEDSAHATPWAEGSSHTPPRPEAPPPHLPPSPCFFHLRFRSGKPRESRGDGWKTAQRGSWSAPWAGQLEEERDRGGRSRSPRSCLAAPSTDWIVCQALPGVGPVSWRDFWAPGEEEQDWMEGVQHDEIWCRRMVCVERALGTKVARPKRTVGCLPHLLPAWPLSGWTSGSRDRDEHYCSAPCCMAATMHGKQTCRGLTPPPSPPYLGHSSKGST
ncbi:uncharacterized protein LOC115803467 [Delphinapterus leucas]|uniref:Uncharacterized protein LOC115803467 n=1 Tax=Delphinapterus leucas TaxID=9749 RepID=A0A7F8KG84_DELLE|nr:uncharacterized protein LOC115803467 [Delphinapterus leucas]